MAKFLHVVIAGLEYSWQALKNLLQFTEPLPHDCFTQEYFYIRHNLYLEWMYAIGQLKRQGMPNAICLQWKKPVGEKHSKRPE